LNKDKETSFFHKKKATDFFLFALEELNPQPSLVAY